MFWHFDGSLQPYPNLASLLRAMKLSDSGGQTEFCNTYAAYDDLPQTEKITIVELQVVHSAEAFAVRRAPRNEPRRNRVLAEVTDEDVPHCLDSSIRSQVVVARRDRRLRQRANPSRRAEPCLLACRLGDPAPIRVPASVGTRRPRYLGQHRNVRTECSLYAADSGRLMHRTILAGEEPLQSST